MRVRSRAGPGYGVGPVALAAAAVTVLSSMAVAALHENDTQLSEQWSLVTMVAERFEADAHLEELLREHRNAVFGN